MAQVIIVIIILSLVGVYWIYILLIDSGCFKGNFQYTPALEKGMAIHCREEKCI